MAKSTTLAAVKFFEKQLKAQNVNVTKIILFGSQARGNASPESDVDIVLISKDFRNKGIFKRLARSRGGDRYDQEIYNTFDVNDDP
jgi:predicted nucleotidyltransferase